MKIYSVTDKKSGYRYFQVADFSSGRRVLRSVGSQKEAIALARSIATSTAAGKVEALRLSNEDARAYLRALEILKPIGVSLEVALSAYVNSVKKLGGRSLDVAIADYVRRHPTTLPERTSADVLGELLEMKRRDGLSKVYLKDLTFRLGKFVGAFSVQVFRVETVMIDQWLRDLRCGPRGRNNYRRAVISFFAFAASRGYILKHQIDFENGVALAVEKSSKIEIFTPPEIRTLLNASQVRLDALPAGFNRRYALVGLTPFLALGAFAGLRAAEIERQLWEDINLTRGYIRVTAAKGNTAQKRLVPISDNLREWLRPFQHSSGLVSPLARTSDALRRLSIRAGVPWKHNALRHSFISYRVALLANMPQTALEAGNSVSMINRHYRELVTPEDAKEWFSVVPSVPTNRSGGDSGDLSMANSADGRSSETPG